MRGRRREPTADTPMDLTEEFDAHADRAASMAQPAATGASRRLAVAGGAGRRHRLLAEDPHFQADSGHFLYLEAAGDWDLSTEVRFAPAHQYDPGGAPGAALAGSAGEDLRRVRAGRAELARGGGDERRLLRLVDTAVPERTGPRGVPYPAEGRPTMRSSGRLPGPIRRGPSRGSPTCTTTSRALLRPLRLQPSG